MSPATGTNVVRSRKEGREQALVQAAFNQIAERGFEGLRTREVAAGVGLNIATLHYYFPTKEAPISGSSRINCAITCGRFGSCSATNQKSALSWASLPSARRVTPRWLESCAR